ncbi:MAG: phospholipase D-like domain-containing protein [Terriglobia bacterium]|jgi:hypothetical protein
MSTFEDIDKVIQANLQQFKKPGALTVRPGYKIRGDWITQDPAIVVTVSEKRANISPQEVIPPRVGNYSTDVRQATTIQKLRFTDPQKHANVVATARPEYNQPEFALERDAQTGQLLKPAPAAPAVTEMAARPLKPYTPAPGSPLTAVTAKMSITCHASPDAGWPQLNKFLQGIKQQLTVGMYDFTSAHVLQAVKVGLAGKQDLSLVLDHPAPNPTLDQTDEQTEQALATALGVPPSTRFQFAWAAETRDPKITNGIFPNAYHIKVAVKDHQSFWLSSGNWNDSNQPNIDPFAPGAERSKIDPIARKSDRDWHVIVEEQKPDLAKTFEAYLQNDLKCALPLQAPQAAAHAAAAALPPETKSQSPEPPMLSTSAPAQYFQPLQITDGEVTVQPLLTPDTGAGNYAANILKLIQSATSRLYIQTQYIHPPHAGTDAPFQALIDAVKEKMNKGLDARIILSEYEATGGWLEKLQAAGLDMSKVRIQNGVHNKGFVIDSKVVALGSQNWSGDGVLRNRDASLIIYHQGAAQYFEKIFLHDWATLAKQKLSSQSKKPIAATP